MAEYINKIRTESGDLRINYQALANLPQSDRTLSTAGSFADAQVTGQKFAELSESIQELTDRPHLVSVNEIEGDEAGNATLTAKDVGAAEEGHIHDRIISGDIFVLPYDDDEVVGMAANNSKNGSIMCVYSDDAENGILKYSTSVVDGEDVKAYKDGTIYSTLNPPPVPSTINMPEAALNHIPVFDENGTLVTSNISILSFARIEFAETEEGENVLYISPIVYNPDGEDYSLYIAELSKDKETGV